MTIEQLEALVAEATPLPLELTRYAHGGGRVFNVAMRELVADFFSKGDRDLFLPMRESFPALLAVAKAAKFFVAIEEVGGDAHDQYIELAKAVQQLEAKP